MTNPDLTNKNRAELLKLAETTEALKLRYRERYIDFIMPSDGPYSRQKYHKAMEFFKAGKDHRFRMLGGANGSGKSFSGALELAYHVTGEYPDWWEGYRQEAPKQWWIVCKSAGTFKSSLQRLLIGETLNDEDFGTGLIPKAALVGYSGWPSVSGTVGSFQVRHKKGHIVTIEVKSSEQDRANLQAANLDGIVFDEEPPLDIYTECVFRLRGSPRKKPGISMLLFTPLNGLSDVVLQYLESGTYPQYGVHSKDPDKYVVRVDMDDVPHLSDEDKRMYLAQSTPADRCARLHGLPALGAGRVYPVDEDMIKQNYLKIQPHWPRAYGMDFGWVKTAVVWGAKDPETGILYLYGEYYSGNLAPYQHAHAIRERGSWIPGAADPRGDKGSERDGSKLIDEYITLGLNLQVNRKGKSVADNAINAGVARVLNMMESGMLKITYNLENWFKEFRVYRYDPKDPNKLAKNQDDHLMDATKYLVSCFDEIAISAQDAESEMNPEEQLKLTYQRNQGRNDITGY
jgi:phage terminase large subunit-like protein